MAIDRTGTKVIGIIPARYDSVRFPGKLLYMVAGKPIIQYTYERAVSASVLDDVIVATDDRRIFRAVESFGGKVMMTAKNHRSGTERIAEAADKIQSDIVVNIQGDEPTIMPESIDQVARLLQADPEADMGTLAYIIEDSSELANTNTVKVVLGKNGYALYFSRAMIPHTKSGRRHEGTLFYHHVGIYSYRREVLLKLSSLPPSPLEISEELEQLRALENGLAIKVGITEHRSVDVNTQEDLEKIKETICQNISS